MSLAINNRTVSKWNKLNVSPLYPQCSLKINDMKYCSSQKYGVTFNEHESAIICRVLDVCEGTLRQYSLRNKTDDIFTQLFDTKIVQYYWVNECYIVLMVFNSLDQSIHHIGFKVDVHNRTMYPPENEKSISPISSEGRQFTTDEIDGMPWLGGISKLVVRGEAYVVVSTIERLIINKYVPDCSFQGRQILNLCTDQKEDYLSGATPFAYGSNLYFVLHQSVAHFAHDGEDRRKLFADRIACVDMSNLDFNQEEMAISDETVDFMYLPFKRLGKGDFYTTHNHELRQYGHYILIEERKPSARSTKRPATKKTLFVIDLLENTVVEQKVRMRCDSVPTLLLNSVLVFRTVSSVDGNRLEYKIEPIGPTPRLETIALHEYIMNGQLPKDCRHLFFS